MAFNLVLDAALLSALVAAGFVAGAATVFSLIGRLGIGHAVIGLFRIVDGFLIDNIGWLLGLQRYRQIARDFQLFGAFVFLLLIMAFAPLPWAYAGFVGGIIAVTATYRVWATHEQDRDKGIIPEKRRTPTDADYRIEAVGAFVYLFALLAAFISLVQTHSGGAALTDAQGAVGLVGFLWEQMARALPGLDASEVYEWQAFSGVTATPGIGQHTLMIVRTIMDLVLLAVIFGLARVGLRIAAGYDIRPVERALRSGNEAGITSAIDELVRTGGASLETARRFLFKQADQAETAEQHASAAFALAEFGEQRGDEVAMMQAVTSARAALAARSRGRDPFKWAHAQNNLGSNLHSLGRWRKDSGLIEESIEAYRFALEEWTRDRVPGYWATAQNNLAFSLETLGLQRRDDELLEQAIVAYRAALEVWTHQSVPQLWATAQNNLGATLYVLGERKSSEDLLKQAIAAHRTVLTVRTRARSPHDWATSQHNLGDALMALGRLCDDEEVFEQAAAAFRLALKERTPDRSPIGFMQTQSNLGGALRELAVRRKDEALLEQAINTYRYILTKMPSYFAPLDRAKVQYNLSRALRELGIWRKDANLIKAAIAASQAALDGLDAFDPAQNEEIDWLRGIFQRDFEHAVKALEEIRESS